MELGVSEMSERVITFREAINEALDQEMQENAKVILIGEDIGRYGGIFGVTKRLIDKYGEERVRDAPTAESGFIGAAIGAAMMGYRPVVELMFIDFIGVAFDQIINQAAKIRYMSGGGISVPIVIRTVSGAGFSGGAQHSQSLHSILLHIPGLKVVMPSNPYDAKGLLISSIEDDDPVVFIEHKGLYETRGVVPKEKYSIPLGVADIKKAGKDVTVIATAVMLHKTLSVVEKLREEGISVEVIDPRSLRPLDTETIANSVKKTGRLVVVDESYPRCSFATDIASFIASKYFEYLEAPIKIVTPPDTPVPYSLPLERAWIPNEEKIYDAIKKVIEYKA
ncbi:MAG: alpha-ketoacid dehydrogenase subunit beta [Fervidicoccus fontis]|nr:MAG: alpha-ketoacid dehydrogenase subunit beta [Fervidicoccus fontis]